MDFAAMMAAQIAKAKGSTAPKSASSDPATAADSNGSKSAPAKKFITNAEAERQREAAYRAEQARLAAEREAKAAAKRKREDEAAAEAKAREQKRQRLAEESRRRREAKEAEEERLRRERLGLPPLPEADGADDKAQGSDDEDEGAPSEEEIRRLFRERGLPVCLFGETRRARLRRLRLSDDVPIPTTLQAVDEKDMKLDGKMPEDKAGRKLLARKLTSYFNMVLAQWEETLRREGQTPGSKEYSTMAQSRDTLRPLFRKLEKRELDDEILKAILEIVQAAQERRYVDANDGYLRLSIGKAAWPIGVTMVGIHERSAREKLHNGEKGHVMGDEVTRKYLQSIKRMLTFAQTRWPPQDINQLMG
ncbi:hypothetical protein PpBr36_05170 [Pyricularia pennisetigena]|uniref:hypothetical protein n=1 Tax=Pyricularia pennisetigena TaxID=1578925 RepID=UPI0011508F7E|nr:hypothetical protein PpBr36_05170 [Pyricularia pennisetigena]TLS26730.1 hypothetical protein PpBr36_05170 [Pyricularia pennisetigena]